MLVSDWISFLFKLRTLTSAFRSQRAITTKRVVLSAEVREFGRKLHFRDITMHRACQLVLITASVVLFCDAGFIPFKRHHSVDPDVGRNVVSKRLSFRLLYAKDFHSFALLLMISVLRLEKKTFPPLKR